jgi:hypothetical protein
MEWYIPITIIPGVALLILSTSNFIIALGVEIQQLQTEARSAKRVLRKKISQLNILSLAIVMLYVSIALFTLSGMLIGLITNGGQSIGPAPAISVSLAMLTLFSGISLLILFAIRAVRIRKQQYEINN